MKKILFAVASFVLLLSSCTNDEIMDIKKDVIEIYPTIGATTRVGAAETTAATLDEFSIKAYTTSTSTPASTLYFKEEVNKISGVWEPDNTHFWPDAELDFYAVSPKNVVLSEVGTDKKQQIVDYVVTGDVDLLYAAKSNVARPANGAPVTLNFRHALSELIFRATSANERLGVSVNGVKVANIYSKATLDMTLNDRFTDTDSNLQGSDVQTEVDTRWAMWGTPSVLTTYEATTNNNVDVRSRSASNGGPMYLTKFLTGDEEQGGTLAGLFVLPQTVQYWDPTAAWETEQTTKNYAYFIISCKVWNITGDSEIDANPVYLWGSATTYKDIAVPVVVPDSDPNTVDTYLWKQGKKYEYIFNFSLGAGFVPPVPGEESEPILAPIEVSVTVDNFQVGNESEQDTTIYPDLSN